MPSPEALPPAVVVLVGVPAPLTVYGFNARGKGVEQHRPLRGELHFEAPLPTVPWLPWLPWQAGVGAALSTVLGARDGDLQVKTRFTTIDAGVLVGPLAGLSLGVAPALLFEHLYLDEGINLDTVSVGVRTRARFAGSLCAGGSVLGVLEAGWERYGAPLDRGTYFNERLGGTVLVSLGAGVMVLIR